MDPIAVIGAGPYGLSVAAHLRAAQLPTLTFGRPMEFWEGMPAGMYLRSAWSASNLSAPGGRYSLDRYLEASGTRQQLPIPLPFFVEYGRWFQQHAVPAVDPTYVRCLAAAGAGFDLELADGRQLRASRVVVAAGIHKFAHVPAFANALPPNLASHTGALHDVRDLAGAQVAVVGGGQSAIESAALLTEAGAQVELIVRNAIRWLTLHDYRGPIRKLLYAPSDVGPPGLNWLLHFPLIFRRLPVRARKAITRRAVRPAGARWLFDRVVGRVRITEQTLVLAAAPAGDGVGLELSDGTRRQVDHVLLGTGYRPNLRQLPFLSPALADQILDREGFPVLNKWLESSVPGLHFAGGLADRSYGPICRFVSGADIASRQITARAAA